MVKAVPVRFDRLDGPPLDSYSRLLRRISSNVIGPPSILTQAVSLLLCMLVLVVIYFFIGASHFHQKGMLYDG